MKVALSLAWSDLRHNALASFCIVASLCGILLPMGLVLSLKIGLVDRLVSGLVDTPVNREIIVFGAGHHDQDFFDRLESEASVGFVIPNTRPISAQADRIFVETEAGRASLRNIELVPSGPGDPLLEAAGAEAPQTGQVILSQAAADKIGLSEGPAALVSSLVVSRVIDGQSQAARADVDIIAILPEALLPREAALISLPDLVSIERFRDRVEIETEGWFEPGEWPDHFASMRVYATEMSSLDTAVDWLRKAGLEARPRAQNIVALMQLQTGVAVLYAIVSILAALGFIAALAANLRGVVQRQRRDLSLMAFYGMTPLARAAIPYFQAQFLVLTGVLVSLLLLALAVPLLNRMVLHPTGVGSALLPFSLLTPTLVAAILVALIASLWAGQAASAVEPVEVLQDQG